MKLTAKEKKYIEKRVAYWQEIIGITDWKVFVRFGKGKPDTRADISFLADDRTCTILFSEDFDDVWTEIELDQTAFHEVSEIKYRPIRQVVGEQFASEIIHMLIRHDENTWFKYCRNEQEV